VGIASLAGQAARGGLWSFLSFLAIINLNLGLINLFPFPGLDGGRLVFVLVELSTGRKVPERIENVIHLAGFVLLIALILFVTWKDIVRIF
jgi:regulator of sigma E protease